MATDLKSHAQDVDLTRFWGGDTRGVCVRRSQHRRQSHCREHRSLTRFS